MTEDEALQGTMDALFDYFRDGSPLTPYIQDIGFYGYILYESREMLLMYLHLLVSAIFPIYIGSHASLRCPPSAEAAKKPAGTEEDDDLDEEAEPIVEGLQPSDAILFPIGAGFTLGGLYLLITWLKDPSILNKILNWYFSAIGVFGVGKLAADALNVGVTFVFPSAWSSKTQTYYVDLPHDAQGSGTMKTRTGSNDFRTTIKESPLPGFLSNVPSPSSVQTYLWSLRTLLKNHWILRLYIHGLASVKSNIKLNDITGLLLGILTIVLYNTIGRTWWLSNIIAFGFCYGTLQLMSPTTFWTGTLVLAGLFIYDITMVFYTPLMVTVATKLDAPIKLSIPGPGRGSMLGLGDIVLPGIMMALALRFDLYLHYLYKQKKEVESSKAVVKEEYKEATGLWGERFWTSTKEATVADGARFKKTYFIASVIGYFVAMIVTLVVMIVYEHAQPALLYLVPGVLTALWGTALVRGELKLMWEYTEDGKWGFDKEAEEEGSKKGASAKVEEVLSGKKTEKEDEKKLKKENKTKENAHHVFLFSLSEPKSRTPKPEQIIEEEGSDDGKEEKKALTLAQELSDFSDDDKDEEDAEDAEDEDDDVQER